MTFSQVRGLRDGVVGFASLKGFANTEYDAQALGQSKGSLGGDKLENLVSMEEGRV